MKKYINYLIRMYKIYILKDKFLLAHKAWVKDNGDATLRLEYNLNNSSIVFDIGGYEGDFTENIFNKYQANVYIFEPVKSFYNVIKGKFQANKKIKYFNFGFSNNDKKIEIYLDNDGSSVYGDSQRKEIIQLKSILDFIYDNKIERIDLCKINIEGGEFDILPTLINSPYINSIQNLQIQFHNFIDNAEVMRNEIREQLLLTHELTYDYYFIWENWKLKK